METKNIRDFFAKASIIDENKKGHLAEYEWKTIRVRDGIKRFKRAALGYLGTETLKTLEEMAQLLYQTGIASSIKEGIEIAPFFNETYEYYTNTKYLLIDKVKNHKGNKKYKICVHRDFTRTL